MKVPLQTFLDAGADPLKLSEQKIQCPNCLERGVTNPKDKCLSVNIGKNVFNCHKCGDLYYGVIEVEKMKEYKMPDPIDSYELNNKAKDFFQNRGISLNTLKRFRVTSDDQRIRFNYYKNDLLFNIKSRFPQKKFTLEKDAEINFYNYDALNDDMVIITEGEIDCLTVYECNQNLPVVSLPNGANSLKFIDSEIDRLDRIDEIVLAVDGDEAGLKARDALLVRFGTEKTSYIEYPKDTKDLNEVLLKYGKEKVLECIKNRKKLPVKAVNHASDFEETITNFIMNGFPEGLKTGDPRIDDKITLGFGEFVVVTGVPNSGKSTLLDYLTTLHVKNNPIVKVGICSAESIIPIQITKIARHYLRYDVVKSRQIDDNVIDCMSLIEDRYAFVNTTEIDDMKDKTIINKMKQMNKRFGCNYFIIDPYNYIDRPTGYETHAPILRSFADFAKAFNSLVILVAHPRKMNKDGSGNYEVVKPYDIAGSNDFFGIPDTILSFWRDFVNKDAPNELFVQKVRNEWRGEAPNNISFDYIRDCKSYRPI